MEEPDAPWACSGQPCCTRAYLLDRGIFDRVRVVVVVDDFHIFGSFCFAGTAEGAVQVGLSCSFSAHGEVSGLVQLNTFSKRKSTMIPPQDSGDADGRGIYQRG